MSNEQHPKSQASPRLESRASVQDATSPIEESLRAAQRMLAEAHLGSWEFDFASEKLTWSRETYHIFGVDPASFTPSATSVLALIHPDDRAELEAAYADAIASHRAHNIEFRIVRDDGVVRRIRARGSTFYDSDGNPLRLIGSIQDVTEHRLTELRLRDSQIQLATALELTRSGPWEYDVASDLFTFNDTFYAVYGTNAEEMGGYQMTPEEYARRFVDPEDIPVITGEMQMALETGDPEFSRELEHRFRYANGDAGILAVKFRVMQDATGRTIKTYGVNQDITKFRRLEQELTLSKALSAIAVECAAEGIVIVDKDRNAISHNHVFLDMWRIPKWLMDWKTDEALLKFIAAQLESPECSIARIEYLYEHTNETVHDKLELKDGRVFERDSVPLFDDNGKYLARAWFFRDITKRIYAERALRESEENLRTIFASVREGIFVMEPHTGKFIEVNEAGCKMFGYDRDEIVGANIDLISSGEAPYSLASALEMIRDADVETGEMDWHCKTQDGRLFWAAAATQRAPFRGQKVLMVTLRDITERKEAEATIAELARYDALTGLANRRVFVAELKSAVSRTSRSKGNLAVLFLDLDHFKDVNDTLGHHVGDLLLKEVAQRIRSSVRDIDTVSRFGGDEFAVMAADLASPEDAAILAQKLLHTVRQPYLISGNDVRCGTSIGIATLGPDTATDEALIAHADVALYRAKTEGRGTFRFFTEEMDRDVKRRVSLAAELRDAISQGQLELFYQPEVDLVTGDISGLEALVRWNHPRRGLLTPHEFIPVAERGGIIIELGRWVLSEACRQASIWKEMDVAPEFVAVNLSALQFKTPEELQKDIEKALDENALPAEMLELELTETILMETTRRNSASLRMLHDKGIRIAIDDFGTGYSSLDNLHRLPACRIKIAQEFVADIETSQKSRVVVRAALGLASELGLDVVAEGIETPGQLVLLKSWGRREGQGFYFSPPRPAPEITELLQGRRGFFAAKEDAPDGSQADDPEIASVQRQGAR